MACVAGVPHETQSSLFCLYLGGCVAGVPHDALASLLADVNGCVAGIPHETQSLDRWPLPVHQCFRYTNANAIVTCC